MKKTKTLNKKSGVKKSSAPTEKAVILSTSTSILETPAIKSTGSFDELYNRDEKEVDREHKHHMAKNGKMLQLVARINDLKMRITKAESEYARSLTDPTKDSVECKIELKCMNEELLIANGIFHDLFPEGINAK